MAALNATQGSLLGFLHDGPMTGWDILQRIQGGLSRFWNATPSHVYRELRVLEERRLIKGDEPGVRDRVPFSITPAGRRAFQRWINQPPGPEQMRFPLLVTLWFGRHLDPPVLAAFLEDSQAEHAGRLQLYEQLAGSRGFDEPARDAVIRFGIAYETAIVAWLDELRDTTPAVPSSGRRPTTR